MALYDYYGGYLMDEELAAMDIQKIREAKALIETACGSLQEAINQASNLKGFAASVYEDKLQRMKSRLANEAGKCEDCVGVINNAISTNQKIAEAARKKKEARAADIRNSTATQDLAATVITQNTKTTSLKDKVPEPAADSFLGGLF